MSIALILQEILRRTQDTNDSVRRQAYLVISTKSHVRDLTSKERARLINSGLGDRSPSVVSAAQSLLQAWLTEGCESNILDLLELIDVHAYPGTAFAYPDCRLNPSLGLQKSDNLF